MTENHSKMCYGIDPDAPAPNAGEYIVSIGKRGICSVWLISAVRKVRHKVVRDEQCYALQVVRAPEVKPLTDFDPETNEVWVRGEPAHPMYWYPRGKK